MTCAYRCDNCNAGRHRECYRPSVCHPASSVKPGGHLERVRVDGLRPGDLLVGSSRTVTCTPGRDASTPRRHVQLVVSDAQGRSTLVTWRARTLVFVRRPTPVLPPRADLDG